MSLPLSQIKAHKILNKTRYKTLPLNNMETYPICRAHVWSKMFPATSMLPISSLETMCWRQASLLCSHKSRLLYSTGRLLEYFWSKVCDMIICFRHCKREETRRRWQQTAPYTTRFVAGAAGVDLCLVCRDPALPLLVYSGHGLSYTLPQHLFWQVCEVSGPAWGLHFM